MRQISSAPHTAVSYTHLFFAALPEDEEIQQHQQEIIYAVFSQIEDRCV